MMKMNLNLLFFASCFLLSFQLIAQETIVLDGIYKGQDLFVKNPFAPEGVGFCAYEVKVNGLVTSDELNSSAFIIDLSLFDLKSNEPVEVILKHKMGCKPEFINTLAIFPESSFEIVSMNLADDGLLKWTTSSESGPLMFRVEQFKWNKWVQVGELIGNGKSGNNNYSFQGDLHFGKNQFRVSQANADGSRRNSKVAEVLSNRPAKIELLTEKVRDRIEFSGPTGFELFNSFGDLIQKGQSKSIDVSQLDKGTYYLNYANITSWEFFKR